MKITTTAEYQQHPIDELNNNPFTEAIRPIHNELELRRLLTKVPCTSIDTLPPLYRSIRINALRDSHVPHPSSFNIYQKIIELLLMGYSKRNPLAPHRTRLLYAIAEKAKEKKVFAPEISSITTAPASIASGPSGSGKTTTIKNVLALIPQVIRHSEYKNEVFSFDQLLWISFDCPANASIKALALNFMRQVDNALSTDYHKEWSKKNRETVDAHLAAIQLIAAKHGLGFVHIDEIQFLLNYRNSKDTPTLSTFETLFNKIGIPVLLTCTSAGLELFKTEETGECTLTRRMVSEREYRFTTYALHSEHFDAMYSSLFPKDLCINSTEPGQSFKEKFHYLTAGLPAVMNRLARLHHEFIIKNGNPSTDSVETLMNIFRHQFSLIEPALRFLRKGNIKMYEEHLKKSSEGKPEWTNQENKNLKKEEISKQEKIPTIISHTALTWSHSNNNAASNDIHDAFAGESDGAEKQ
ncbi:hypothetical protein CBP51_03235 [Cellvibrio mixtus]|uniref:ORC1/DEAH AAA+ ATPase domain-containing protein n=1 Tax=Cellvibrio mixtus TaxID=39650 RepID=A0A266Q9N2_9GAMM|nr:ATP-binding protein [Cellvibrio mixtus]OZY86059.1 hypothetical protein CBP51_03235 [Cellvibrio mixtus]